ncbi:3-ketosphinganine reductase-like protein [Lophiostoma macrostomum CBS 122681]|uniref:3-dehydrosphinganine reductase n=1 Tax=Lophiostoma macrostomum CBS 122681 TaxID=1314788 RepID=A0A6A6T998_9PLEO|nr:3-ketosphinganine reductase-like protein [Lophiostoma macrostomum CBS 122681]
MPDLLSIGVTLLLLLVVYLSLDIMGLFNWGNKFQVEGRTVLLTGASYGMGREIAAQLSSRGASVILVARNVSKLESALAYAQSLAKSPSTQRFHLISADVTSEAENKRLLAEATTWNGGRVPEIVWTNAGSSVPDLLLNTSVETMRSQMELNYWAAAYLARETLTAWLYPTTPYSPQSVEKGGQSEAPRHLIFTSSVIAFVNIAGYAAYGPAKSAMRALADGLRNEILLYNGARRSSTSTGQAPAPFDVNIHSVFPGTIKSPGFEQENKTKHAVTHLLEAGDPAQSEAECATACIQGLEAGNYSTGTNWLSKLMRVSSLGGTPRNNWVLDICGQWVASIVWIFVLPDLEGKVWGWGKKEGMPARKTELS